MRFFLLISILLISCSIDQKKNTQIEIDKFETIIFDAKKFEFEKNYLKAKEKYLESIFIKATANAYLKIAEIESKLENFEDSKYNLEKALELEPNSEEILLKYAYIESKFSNYNSSIKIYKKLLEINPREEIYIFNIAILYKKLDKLFESENYFNLIDKKNYKNKEELYSQLGDLAFQKKDYANAEKYYNIAKKKSNSKVLDNILNELSFIKEIELGNNYLKNKNYSSAIQSFIKAKNISPNNYLPYLFLGNAELLNQNKISGEENLLKSINLNPKNKEGYVYLSNYYIQNENFIDAEKIISKAKIEIQNDSEIYNLEGVINIKVGEIKKAYISFFKSKELNKVFLIPRINLAITFISEDRFSEARYELESAIKIEPTSIEIKNLFNELDLIEKLSKIEKRNDNINSEEQSFELNNESIDVLISIANYYFSKKKFAESEKYFIQAKKNNENLISPLIGLARIYSLNKEKEKLLKIEKNISNKYNLDFLKGVYLEDSGKLFEAEKYYLEKNILFPNEDFYQLKLKRLYIKIIKNEHENENFLIADKYIYLYKKKYFDLPNEIKRIEKNLEEKKYLSDSFLEAGNRFFNNKEYIKAIIEYKKSFSLNKNYFSILKISESYQKLNQNDKAIQVLDDSIKFDPKNKEEYLLEKGKIYTKQKDFFSAKEIFESIIKLNPENYNAYYNLGILYLDKNKFFALENFDKSIALNPNYSIALLARGILNYKLGRRNESKKDFELSIQKNLNQDLAYLNLGILYLNENLLSDAESYFTLLKNNNPSSIEAYYNLSLIEFKRKNFSKSEFFILKALEIKRNSENISAYIKILEEKNKELNDKNNLNLIQNLKKEILDYDKNDNFQLNNKTSLVEIFLFDKLYTEPILVGKNLILNYGTYLYNLDTELNYVNWKIEFSKSYKSILIKNQIYAIKDNIVDIFNFHTGDKINSIKSESNIELITYDNGFYLIQKINEKKKIKSFLTNGFFSKEFFVNSDKNIYATSSGKILVLDKNIAGIEIEIYSENFDKLKSFTLFGINGLNLKNLICNTEDCIFYTDLSVYKFDIFGNIKKTNDFNSKIEFLYFDDKKYFFKNHEKIFSISEDLEKIKYINIEKKFGIYKKYWFKNDEMTEVYDSKTNLIWKGKFQENTIIKISEN